MGTTADALETGNQRDDFAQRSQSRSSRPNGPLVVKCSCKAGDRTRLNMVNRSNVRSGNGLFVVPVCPIRGMLLGGHNAFANLQKQPTNISISNDLISYSKIYEGWFLATLVNRVRTYGEAEGGQFTHPCGNCATTPRPRDLVSRQPVSKCNVRRGSSEKSRAGSRRGIATCRTRKIGMH